MKIFKTIPWFHPAYKAGGPIQSVAGMVKQLSGFPFEFSIICSNRDIDGVALDTVVYDQWVQYSANTRVWYSKDKKIVSLLNAEMTKSKPHLLYIIGLYDWNYNIKPLLFSGGIKKIISVRGMLHPGALSQKPLKKKLYLALWKLMGWHKKHLFHVTDETEGEFVRKIFGPGTRIAVAGNFPALHSSLRMPPKLPGELKLCSVALIGPMKNHLEVLKALLTIRGKISYQIYGPVIDKSYWMKCQHIIGQMPANVSVAYCGSAAPTEIEKILAENHVVILPSKSENYGHSIIEALSAGRPVITSNNTPWNKLQESIAGMNVDPENSKELVNAIERFVKMEHAELEEWGKGASAYAVKAVDVEMIQQQYRRMFNI